MRLTVASRPAASRCSTRTRFPARRSRLEIDADPIEGKPQLTVRYTSPKTRRYLLVETIYSNPTRQAVEDELSDAIRADRTFTFGTDPATHLLLGR